METTATQRGWPDIPDTHWRAYFGAQADDYMDQLTRVREGRSCAFNWPALLLGFLWMVYRKMYVVALIAFLFTAMIGTVELALELLLGLGHDAVNIMEQAVNIGSAVTVGVFANRVYLWHAARQIREEMAKGPFHLEDVLLANIARRGGTSWMAVLGVIGAMILLIAGLVMLDIPI